MPRCVAMADQSPGMPRASSASTSARRLSLIRSRIPASSISHRARRSGSDEDRADDVGAVCGRVGVVDADGDLHVALDRGGVRGGARDHDQRPDPLRVERERLGERGRDQELRARPHQLEQARGVLDQAVAEALVGEVDERQQAPLLDEVADPLPQVGGGVHAGRVVAGAVEQDDVARAGLRRAPRAARPRRSGARSRPCTGRCGSGSPPRGTAAGGWATWARSSTASGPTPVWRSRSAATRRPPVPPGVWVASARPEVTASWSAPSARARTSSR